MNLVKNSFLLIFVLLCSFIFINCSKDDLIHVESLPSYDPGTNRISINIPGSSNDNNDNDVSDFAWSKINWLHTNVSGSSWQESSQITSVEVKSNGQICINHTQANDWPSRRIGNADLVGNPWVIVKINGKYYAATYEWLRPGQICKFGHSPDTNSLSKVYNSEHSIGRHNKRSPLQEWVPKGGDVVGFMVSGLARNNVRNVHKRTNIQWYRLPSVDGSIKGKMLHSTSSHNNDDRLGQCEVPNRFSVLQQVARDYPHLLKNSNNCPPHYRNGGTYDFLEKVLVELRKTDTKWGYYHRTQHNLQHASSDAIAYYCGEGDDNGSSDLRFVDVITSSCQVSWQDQGHEDRARPENGYWKYPRLSSTPTTTITTTAKMTVTTTTSTSIPGIDNVSDFAWSRINWLHKDVSRWAETSRINSVEVKSNGEICIYHTQADYWPSEKVGSRDLAGNPWVIVKVNNQYYAATYGWLKLGQTCKFGHSPNTNSLSKVYNSEHSIGRHTKRSPLQEWVPKGGDIIGFMVSGLARSGDRNVSERSDIVWYRLPSVNGSIQGRVVGRSSNDVASCSKKEVAQGFRVKNGRCLPPCSYFHKNNPRGVKMAVDAECEDIQNYNISIVTKETHDATICCRRSSKQICPSPHYSLRTHEDESNCFPSCGHAANLAGWGHYGDDRKKRTQDDPHYLFSTSSACDDLNALSHDDWKNLPKFYDRYRFKSLSYQEVAEALMRGEGGCCRRGAKTTKPSQPYPFSVTVTTTTTTQQVCTCDNTQVDGCGGTGCIADDKDVESQNPTIHGVDYDINRYRWTCRVEGGIDSPGCYFETRTCTGHHDGCLDGDGKVNGRTWAPLTCSADSNNRSCEISVCDRSKAVNCSCVEVECKTDG